MGREIAAGLPTPEVRLDDMQSATATATESAMAVRLSSNRFHKTGGLPNNKVRREE